MFTIFLLFLVDDYVMFQKQNDDNLHYIHLGYGDLGCIIGEIFVFCICLLWKVLISPFLKCVVWAFALAIYQYGIVNAEGFVTVIEVSEHKKTQGDWKWCTIVMLISLGFSVCNADFIGLCNL